MLGTCCNLETEAAAALQWPRAQRWEGDVQGLSMKVDAFPVIPRGFLDLGWIAGGYLTIYII